MPALVPATMVYDRTVASASRITSEKKHGHNESSKSRPSNHYSGTNPPAGQGPRIVFNDTQHNPDTGKKAPPSRMSRMIRKDDSICQAQEPLISHGLKGPATLAPSPAAPQSRQLCFLLQLPTEIRIQIWKQVIEEAGTTYARDFPQRLPFKPGQLALLAFNEAGQATHPILTSGDAVQAIHIECLSILLANKRIFREVLDVLYGQGDMSVVIDSAGFGDWGYNTWQSAMKNSPLTMQYIRLATANVKVRLGRGGGFVKPSKGKRLRQNKADEFLDGFAPGTKLSFSVCEGSLKMLMREDFAPFFFLRGSRGLKAAFKHCGACEYKRCGMAEKWELTVEYWKDSEGFWVEENCRPSLLLSGS